MDEEKDRLALVVELRRKLSLLLQYVAVALMNIQQGILDAEPRSELTSLVECADSMIQAFEGDRGKKKEEPSLGVV